MFCKKCHADLPDDALFCLYCGAKQAPTRVVGRKRRGNGQGSIFKTPSGKFKAEVVLDYYTQDGRKKKHTVSKLFTKKADALAAIPVLKKQLVKSSDYTLVALYDAYIGGRDYAALSKSQRDKLGYAWTRLAPIARQHIGTLTVDDLQTVVDTATSTYYPARDMKVLLSHLYDIAIRREIVTSRKSDYIDLPDAPKAKRECWTKDEIAALWADYATHPFTGYLLIMCYAGLRYGEIASIPLDRIFLDESYMIGGIKTEAGIDREIPIHTKIKPIVARYVAERNKKLLEMNEDNFYTAYWLTIDRTGLRHLPPQTCRHYYFSSLTAAGVQGGIIAEAGGHASFITTMKNYVRIPLADKIKAVESID